MAEEVLDDVAQTQRMNSHVHSHLWVFSLSPQWVRFCLLPLERMIFCPQSVDPNANVSQKHPHCCTQL